MKKWFANGAFGGGLVELKMIGRFLLHVLLWNTNPDRDGQAIWWRTRCN
jgi:hypothetical protein